MRIAKRWRNTKELADGDRERNSVIRPEKKVKMKKDKEESIREKKEKDSKAEWEAENL